MGVSASNLTMGPGTLYHAPFGTAEPADADINTTPASSGWTDVGGTTDGIQLKVDQTYKELEVDQIVDIPGRRLTKREATIETKLAEPTLANLSLVLNAGTPMSGANYSTYTPGNDTSASQPRYAALCFDGIAPGGFRRRVILRKTLSVEGISLAYSKDNQSVFTASFSAHYVSPSIPPFRVIDQTA
ncbi:phage tail tube protein [Parafrankia discariae]|uniref:phage tail tube protein n=1 Tax=Parafrankia discariae TaxID=365528 RepID=UPI00036C02E5|nr:hypothetical protein [Parafrankia discariae]